MNKILVTLAIVLCAVILQTNFVYAQITPAQNQLKITSVEEKMFLGTSVYVSGQAAPGAIISVNIEDPVNAFAYSVRTKSDANGSWKAYFNQSLKSGSYLVNALQYDSAGNIVAYKQYGPIKIRGSFVFIVAVLSALVVILLAGFVGGWYINKQAEIKRYRRILISQRDIVASYEVLKGDVEKALKDLQENQPAEGKINEVSFRLRRISDNIEKMNKYVAQGISIIGKYDIISKIDDTIKKEKF